MNLIKTEFLYMESRTTLEGSAFILSTAEPFYVGNILTFKDSGAFLNTLGSQQFIWYSVVPGYRIIIHLFGSLQLGRVFQITTESIGKETKICQDMVEYFIKERINLHPKYYNRFYIKENNHETTEDNFEAYR